MRAAAALAWAVVGAILIGPPAAAGQAPGAASKPDVPISHRDRFYTSDQFSNTVSVIDPANNELLGVIRLGDTFPGNFNPLYRGQLLVHGMGFSPDHRTLAVVSVGSNSVSFIDTETNALKNVTYVGRSPHEAFFTPDAKEVWVTVRGESYVAVLDGATHQERLRIPVPNGPGMTIFSPDGAYGYVCSSFTPETVVVSTRLHRIVGRVQQESPFCPDIAATPDGKQVWFTQKDTGKVVAFNARPPFQKLKVIDSGPITNHVNFARNPRGQFAYVTIGGSEQVKVYRTDTFELLTTISVGALPHGLWPSGDGARMYVGLENADSVAVIDTVSNVVLATIAIGQAPNGVAYVSNAVPHGDGRQNLVPLGAAGNRSTLSLGGTGQRGVTQVTLFDQGLIQVLQAAVSGLAPAQSYVLALSSEAGGGGEIEPLASFTTNAAGAAIVNTAGPLRQIARDSEAGKKRVLVIVSGTPSKLGERVQIQHTL